VTEQPWGMVFRNAGDFPRHPSQLYEFALEGVVLFMILFWYARKNRPNGAISGMFLIWYGIFRTLVEFFREPDLDKGFIAFGWVTEGQLLSLPMIFIGLFIVYYAHRRHHITIRSR
jgi:phosphatidylglycerol:prolipoprotein diacylglycerol transferase